MAEINILEMQKARMSKWEGGCLEGPEATCFLNIETPSEMTIKGTAWSHLDKFTISGSASNAP